MNVVLLSAQIFSLAGSIQKEDNFIVKYLKRKYKNYQNGKNYKDEESLNTSIEGESIRRDRGNLEESYVEVSYSRV